MSLPISSALPYREILTNLAGYRAAGGLGYVVMAVGRSQPRMEFLVSALRDHS